MQDEGWTRLRRGSAKSKGPASCALFGGIALVGLSASFVVAALRLDPFVSFAIVAVALVFAKLAIPAFVELLWGAGPRVSVSRHPVRAGETFKVRCEFSRPRNVQEVKVVWQGREEAILLGYDTTTFDEPFLRDEVVDAATGRPISIEIAPDAMPSFSGKTARIIWSMSVETTGGGVAMRADFPILVLAARR